jgi:hypothetical protein
LPGQALRSGMNESTETSKIVLALRTSLAEPQPAERHLYAGAGVEIFGPAPIMQIRIKCYKKFLKLVRYFYIY